jgi:hypothetical protein
MLIKSGRVSEKDELVECGMDGGLGLLSRACQLNVLISIENRLETNFLEHRQNFVNLYLFRLCARRDLWLYYDIFLKKEATAR